MPLRRPCCSRAKPGGTSRGFRLHFVSARGRLLRVERSLKEGKAPGAAGCQVGLLSLAGQPAGSQTAGAFGACSDHPCRAHCQAARVHFVRRALRRIWVAAGPGHHVLAAGQHLGFPGGGRHGGGGGDGSTCHYSYRAGLPRFRVLGYSLPFDFVGGSATPAVCSPTLVSKPEVEGVRWPDSSAVGHHHPCVKKGDRCDPEPQVGSHQLDQGQGCDHRARRHSCKTPPAQVCQETQGSSHLAGESLSAPAFYEKGPFEGGPGFEPSPSAKAQDLNAAGARAHSSLNLSAGVCDGPSSASCPPGPSLTVHAASSAFVPERPRSRHSCHRPCELGFRAYGLSLAARVVRSRGSFGAFLSASLHLPQDRPPRPAHALFSLPVPFPGCFQHIPSAKASRVRSRVASRRVAHVAVMACNYLFAGASFVPLSLLRHRPNKAQAAALSYVHRLCRACGAVEPFLVSSAGRRNLSLVAQLGELCERLTLVGPSAALLPGAAPLQVCPR